MNPISHRNLSIAFSISMLTTMLSVSAEHERFFNNKTINFLDGLKMFGTSTGIDGQAVHDMYWLSERMRTIVRGDLDRATGTVTKRYTCGSMTCNLDDIAKEEEALYAEREACRNGLLATYGGQTDAFNQAWAPIEQAYQHKIDVLNHTLSLMKHDFMVYTRPFLRQIQGIKPMLCELIQEWSVRCNKPSSLLITWGQVNGNEEEFFKDTVKSAREIRSFLYELADFLSKLIRSCPKALEEYRTNMGSYAHIRKDHSAQQPSATAAVVA